MLVPQTAHGCARFETTRQVPRTSSRFGPAMTASRQLLVTHRSVEGFDVRQRNAVNRAVLRYRLGHGGSGAVSSAALLRACLVVCRFVRLYTPPGINHVKSAPAQLDRSFHCSPGGRFEVAR